MPISSKTHLRNSIDCLRPKLYTAWEPVEPHSRFDPLAWKRSIAHCGSWAPLPSESIHLKPLRPNSSKASLHCRHMVCGVLVYQSLSHIQSIINRCPFLQHFVRLHQRIRETNLMVLTTPSFPWLLPSLPMPERFTCSVLH
ncbi:hypothetical protein DM02DRAFT_724056 [Periconia macrospinosa]|uniref:Uncharacterized protein n=1 Tax=Periconia macrospinosa TaxID=97972 RepID=A0A2V1E8M3_9PLEO|nr:hypothetical protein DM02DRAFT_724056 [Periconia macrospinosa]